MPNPLEIPEILHRIACFVSVEDAMSCMLVCNTFTQAFAYPVWYQIDFNTRKKLADADSTSLRKYGHHVRNVKNIASLKQLNALLNLDPSKLKELGLKMLRDFEYLASSNDLIRRNKTTLTELSILNVDGATRNSAPIVTLDSLGSMAYSPQPSPLVNLALQWVKMTRESFVVVLRSCPSLEKIDIWGTTFIPTRAFIDYKHTGITKVNSMIIDIFNNDSNPSILIHFPNLQHWSTASEHNPQTFPTQAVRSAVTKWCPKVKIMETNFTLGPLLTLFIRGVCSGLTSLTSLTLSYKSMSQDLILTMLRTPSRWKSIRAYLPRNGYYTEFENEGVPPINDPLPSLGWVLQSLPRLCRNLVAFEFPEHVMDMDEAEMEPWACKKLKTLTVRIRGLESRDVIERAIEQWIHQRKGSRATSESAEPEGGESESGGLESTESENDQGIETRVVRHLLQLPILKSVWLGTRFWQLKEETKKNDG